MSQFYYERAGTRFGPFSASQLRRLAAEGNLAPEDLVWRQGTQHKVKATNVQGLFHPSVNNNRASENCVHPDRDEAIAANALAAATTSSYDDSLVADDSSGYAVEESSSPSTHTVLEPPRSLENGGSSTMPRPITSAQGGIIILLMLIGLGSPLVAWLRPTPKWEYKIVAPSDSRLEEEMTSLGSQGWELVAARRASDKYSASYEMMFKRPKAW